MKLLATKQQLAPVFGQFCLAASKQVERILGAAATNKDTKEGGLTMQWRDSSSDLSPDDVDRCMAQYMCNCRDLLVDIPCLSMSTDKGWVNGLPLQNSVIGTPANHAIVCAPQVSGKTYKANPFVKSCVSLSSFGLLRWGGAHFPGPTG